MYVSIKMLIMTKLNKVALNTHTEISVDTIMGIDVLNNSTRGQ